MENNFEAPVTLADTIALMQSNDYKERFKAEYYQLKIRYDKLRAMVEAMDAGTLDFEPTCSRDIYVTQLSYMQRYMMTLECRAEEEKIIL